MPDSEYSPASPIADAFNEWLDMTGGAAHSKVIEPAFYAGACKVWDLLMNTGPRVRSGAMSKPAADKLIRDLREEVAAVIAARKAPKK